MALSHCLVGVIRSQLTGAYGNHCKGGCGAGMLNLSNVGKPKHGRPGSRRKASDPSDDDTAAILMNLAAVAGEASGRPGSAHSPGFR